MRLIMVLIFVLAALLQSPPPVRTVVKGPMSDIESPRQVAVRTDAEWSALWKAHGDAGALPSIDFSREMVVAVFLGSRPTAGYGIEVVRAVAAPAAMIVEYVETTPPRDLLTAQVITAPYHLAAVPKYDGEVTFRRVEK
jgi:hypothetical protein